MKSCENSSERKKMISERNKTRNEQRAKGQ